MAMKKGQSSGAYDRRLAAQRVQMKAERAAQLAKMREQLGGRS